VRLKMRNLITRAVFDKTFKAGEKFKAGDLVEKVIKDLPVMFVTAHEGGRQLLRIIFPDKNGKFPNEKGCDRQFALQPAVEGGSYEEKQ